MKKIKSSKKNIIKEKKTGEKKLHTKNKTIPIAKESEIPNLLKGRPFHIKYY
ncbi:hypothetical protein NLD30_07035 [SCandidatus Aminicenantes bacterium Aminicenantia_JdfR_composite]|jgi:hypothetical protein|nr:hypothetical protein [SCandidatus Aminicenantes bacterium Aminicenantia_JdfR_composite]MCP2596640.1 hypothetical protein [Candidatus Aminicenantes bacterium AC-335-G13]MCP2598034.1 hypothetical protein [Candidatus Aminicenantes bacterium AC-335-L06]